MIASAVRSDMCVVLRGQNDDSRDSCRSAREIVDPSPSSLGLLAG